MTRIRLRDSDDNFKVVNAGSSCDIKATLKDTAGATISSITSATMDLYRDQTAAVINSHSSTDVSAGFSAGMLTIELNASDNVVDTEVTSPNEDELHIARITYGWNDASGDARTNVVELEFFVKRLKTFS